MSSRIRLDVQSGASAPTVKGRLRLFASGFAPSVMQRVADLITGMNGVHASRISVVTTAVQATGTITFSSIVADDTVTVNGVVYTAKVSPSGAHEFALGASDTAAAANFAAKLNADTDTHITGVVTGSAASGVITLTSTVAGNIGNCITIAISAHGSVSGARLSGGTQDTPVVLYNGL